MKKISLLTLCVGLSASLLAGCGNDNKDSNSGETPNSNSTVIPVKPLDPWTPANPTNPQENNGSGNGGENNGENGGENSGGTGNGGNQWLPEQKPDDDSAIERQVDGKMVLPITYAPFTTLQIAHRPTMGCKQYTNEEIRRLILNQEIKVTDTHRYKEFGIGQEAVEGERWNVRNSLLSGTDPALSHQGKSLAWFWQISDPQIADEESPCRLEGITYAPYVTGSAYRAQAKYSTHMFDVHLQTAMRISELASRPFDFVLVTGDISDNAQENENAWFKRLMAGGGVLDPDTGVDDDPVEGPNNDASDPYYTQGIGDIPWYIAIGNHDVLYMGMAAFDDRIQEACTGGELINVFSMLDFLGSQTAREGYQMGFQNASKPESPVVTSGETPADEHRRLLSKSEMLESFYEAPGKPAGHGLDPEIMAQGWGYYSTYPIPDKPILRLITLDTNGRDSEINLTDTQFQWLKDQIADAKSKNELVIVQSHHGTANLNGNITQEDFQKVLASYSGVILHITGHGHENKSNVFKHLGRGYWEVMLASVVDFPSQTRLFEIVYEGEGIISIYITNLDANAPAGSFVDEALNFAAARKFFGFSDDPAKDWDNEKIHRNMILRTKVPAEIAENIEQYDWSDVIESETLLKNLKYKPKGNK